MRRIGRIIVAILAAIGLTVLLLTGGGIWAAIAFKDSTEPRLPKDMILSLDLEAKFRETPSGDPFAALAGERAYVMRQVIAAIDHAATDPKVKGLFATLGSGQLSLASAQEIRDAIVRFRSSGKPSVAFAETLGEGSNGTVDYFLASGFSQVWVQPSGEVGLVGFAAESPFLKGTLDLLGIQPQLAGRKEYKSAIETFTETGYSQPHRQSLEAILDAWSGQVIAGIAQGRRLGQDKVSALFGKGPFLAAEALSAGLVDHLGYRDQALAAAGATGKKGEEVDMAAYAAHLPKGSGPRIAIITGSGAISRGGDDSPFADDDGFGAGVIAAAFRDAVDDPAVKAIVFRIDSPGGSYVASDTIWHEVGRARAAGKPVVASMAGVAASGGYFVAMGADRVVAQPGTITGSIGVFSGKMVLADFWPKLGVSWDGVKRGDNADMMSANHKFSPQAWERLNRSLDAIYADFTGKAAKGRNLAPDRMEELAKGRIWAGSDAQARGLVDALGGWDVAQAQVRELLKLAPDADLDLVAYPKPKAPWQKLAKMMGGGGGLAEDEGMRALLRLARVLAPVAAQLENGGTLRLPAGAVP
ncbi:signal peptide peptidase SppA [Magnetospirillum gryphiswaldense]|uniref:Protease(Signal peptide peptidase) n=2 Tax=Magnetospirillum gryphiswaldense TaxID=55518 RepID=V6F918_MAGGM|nr:signal peptide peptidase SppA [Magnetospirillum gryphiswaldense]AVM76420.1 Protease 4 [Magnetospirillum gryphiswaldense MSR-1]AVM80323.1 Protease 4 [Magnetospirillum gryphiswaldense]CDL01463.1 protease(signal peptide peptidase) [Magnetospirillum gryphiswaldense MSR-1 v2]